MPGNTGHHADVAAPVGRPPFLAVGHQGAQIGLQGLDIERLQGFAIVEGGAERIGLGIVLMQDIEVQRIRPPFGHRFTGGRVASMHDGTLASRF
ncbi:hypothetical protein D3C86_1496280 [compost metagenome]